MHHLVNNQMPIEKGPPNFKLRQKAEEMIQQAFFHNMPLAFATAQQEPVNYYIPLNLVRVRLFRVILGRLLVDFKGFNFSGFCSLYMVLSLNAVASSGL